MSYTHSMLMLPKVMMAGKNGNGQPKTHALSSLLMILTCLMTLAARRTVATAECHAEANVCQCQYLQDLSNIQDCVE